MATKKQIEANRRNGRRSCGPRSTGGKKRASRNGLRHGLASKNSNGCFLVALEKLACRIAGDCPTSTVLEYARAAAEAKLEIGRVRRAKASLVERARALGALVPAKHFPSLMHEIRWCQAMYLWSSGLRPTKPPEAIAIDPLTSMPLGEPERAAEAERRVATELLRLDRYENRAASRKESAIRKMLKAKAL